MAAERNQQLDYLGTHVRVSELHGFLIQICVIRVNLWLIPPL
jgi:hypothetical protein